MQVETFLRLASASRSCLSVTSCHNSSETGRRSLQGKAVTWYRDNGRLHARDPIAMAADALHAYLTDRADQKDTILICDNWEMADALNQRLHDTLTAPGPTVKAARDQQIRVGDIIMSRSNDITIDVKPARRGARADQVRNGNRWRVAAIDPDTNRLAAERAPSASIDSLASSIQCASSMT